MNNNLIIFYTDSSKDVFSFSEETTEAEALKKFQAIRPTVKGYNIKKYFYIQNDDVIPETYGRFAVLDKETEKMKVDYRRLLIAKKIDEVRTKRDMHLKKLDLPFMRSLEDEDMRTTNHIKLLKNFLRDLPSNVSFKGLTDEEALKYNPFGNIFEIALIDGGEGYTIPPKITIDAPDFPGSSAEAVTFVRDGKISKVEMTDYGCGYDFVPKVTIETPESAKEALVLCMLPQNTFIDEGTLKENTQKHYLVP